MHPEAEVEDLPLSGWTPCNSFNDHLDAGFVSGLVTGVLDFERRLRLQPLEVVLSESSYNVLVVVVQSIISVSNSSRRRAFCLSWLLRRHASYFTGLCGRLLFLTLGLGLNR